MQDNVAGLREMQLKLEAHAVEFALCQTALSNLGWSIKEYVQEHEAIRLAAAKLSLFLERSSLALNHDATIVYLDFLIEAQTDKVKRGGSNRKLLMLKDELQQHKEAVKILTHSLKTNANAVDLSEAGVERIKQQLYDLKHFGSQFRSLWT